MIQKARTLPLVVLLCGAVFLWAEEAPAAPHWLDLRLGLNAGVFL